MKGSRVKYGYILKDNIKMEDKVLSFYKSKHFGERIDNDLSIDPFNRNYLRIEIPPDMQVVKHVDSSCDHTIFIVLKGYHKQVKDLNPTIIYSVDRGYRINKKLIDFYINNPDTDVTKVFHNKVKLKGKGRRREL